METSIKAWHGSARPGKARRGLARHGLAGTQVINTLIFWRNAMTSTKRTMQLTNNRRKNHMEMGEQKKRQGDLLRLARRAI